MDTDKHGKRPAVFLDRDGTITPERRDLRGAGEVRRLRLLPGAAEAIRQLNEAGFTVVVISNQSGVARGYFSEAQVQAVNAELMRRLVKKGARIEACYYCPHHPEGKVEQYRKRCRCRKPAAGLFTRAVRELNLAPKKSFVIGDNTRDLAAGRKVGCRGVLVLTGLGKSMEKTAEKIAEYIAPNIAAAVEWILQSKSLRIK